MDVLASITNSISATSLAAFHFLSGLVDWLCEHFGVLGLRHLAKPSSQRCHVHVEISGRSYLWHLPILHCFSPFLVRCSGEVEAGACYVLQEF